MSPASDPRPWKKPEPCRGRTTYSGDRAYGGRQQNVVFEFPTIARRRQFTFAVKLEREMKRIMSTSDQGDTG